MPGRLIYELPKNKEAVSEIIGAIPSDWEGFDAELIASKKMYGRKSKIAENTSLIISRHGGARPNITGISDILLNRKMFAKIQFEEAGVKTQGLTINAVKELIEGFIVKGYQGWVEAYSKRDRDKYHSSPESIYIDHESTITDSGKKLPPQFSLEWDEELGGMRSNIERIVKNLGKLRLKKLDYQEWSA